MTASYWQALFALIFVLSLIGLLAILAKKLGFGLPTPKNPSAKKRLEFVESLALDSRRRVVIIRMDDREHLLLLGLANDLVIQENILSAPSSAAPSTLPSPRQENT